MSAVDSLKASDVLTINVDTKNAYDSYVYADLFDNDGNFICRNTQLLTVAKHFDWQNPGINVDITDCEDGVEISVSSNVFAKGVYIDFDGIDCVLTDNFFDLTDDKPYVVKSVTNHTAKELKEALKVMSVYDIGR